MKKGKNFFYRVDAAEFMAAVFQIPEGEHKQWLAQLALDLMSGVGNTEYSKGLIKEVENYRRKQAEAGSRGGKPRHKRPYTDPIPTLEQPPSGGVANKQLAVNIESKEGVPPLRRDIIWDIGLGIITAAGIPEKNARTFLGKHVSIHKERLAEVISQMVVNPPIEPLSYLEKALQPKKRQVVL